MPYIDHPEDDRPGESLEQMREIRKAHEAICDGDLDLAESALNRADQLGRVGRARLASRLETLP